MQHEHGGNKGMVADVPCLRERRIKYAESMEEVSTMLDDQGEGIFSFLGGITRYIKSLASGRWNEFPLLIPELRHIEGICSSQPFSQVSHTIINAQTVSLV